MESAAIFAEMRMSDPHDLDFTRPRGGRAADRGAWGCRDTHFAMSKPAVRAHDRHLRMTSRAHYNNRKPYSHGP